MSWVDGTLVLGTAGLSGCDDDKVFPARAEPLRPTALAGAVVLVALAATVATVALDLQVTDAQRAAVGTGAGWTAGLSGLALALPGGVLLRRMPRHPVGWVLCFAGVHWALDGLASSWLPFATSRGLAGASLAFWTYERLGAWLLLPLPLVLLLYPDGRLPDGRWRGISLVSLATTALLPLCLLVVPSDAAAAVFGPIPVGLQSLDLDLTSLGALSQAWWLPLLRVARAVAPVSLVVPFVVVVRRYRASMGTDRVRMRWLLWAGVVDVMVMLTVGLLPESWVSVTLLVAVGLTGVVVVIGITRPDIVDVDGLLGGTLLYGALAAAVLLVDGVVVAAGTAGLGDRLAERDAALVALLVVMLVYGPLRQRLWRWIRRLVLGRRDDPYGVVAGLAEQLERSEAPEVQLLAVARAVAQAFRITYVGVEVDRASGERLAVEHGVRPDPTQTLPITYRGEQIGRLVLPARGPRTALSARDGRLLADVVRQAAAASRSSDLAAELQRSRERLVAAREEERRRLRRDLHDGLGPSLGAVALRIDTARNLSRTSPEQADGLLKQARTEVTTALADVRRLVHGLRPPALDDVGLLEAVRQQAEGMRTPGLAIEVCATDELGSLPAAVEVAAYRIASEALANVVRHARAARCVVRLGIQDRSDNGGGAALVVEVTDDGVGIAEGTASGVGLQSLRERAAELGGRCDVIPADGGGTLVRAQLPLRPQAENLEVVGA